MANQGDTRPPAPRPRRPLTDLRREPDSAAIKAAGLRIPGPPRLPTFDPPAPVVEESKPSHSAAIEGRFKVRDLKGWATFISALAAILLSIWNKVDKAPDAKVEAQQQTISAQRTRVDGPDGLSDRVTELEREVWPMTRHRCAQQQWLAQVFDKLGAQRVRVIGCPDERAPVQFTDGPTKRGRQMFLVDSPMPPPE